MFSWKRLYYSNSALDIFSLFSPKKSFSASPGMINKIPHVLDLANFAENVREGKIKTKEEKKERKKMPRFMVVFFFM